MDANQEAAARLRAILAVRKIKAGRFAEAIGQSPMWMSRRLNCEVEMTLNDLALIAAGLDMPLTALVRDEPIDPRQGVPPPSRPAGTSDERASA